MRPRKTFEQNAFKFTRFSFRYETLLRKLRPHGKSNISSKKRVLVFGVLAFVTTLRMAIRVKTWLRAINK